VAVSPMRVFAEISTPETPSSTQVLMKRAVVLGASIAGLLAARVLSDHAEQVVLIERDDSDTGIEPGQACRRTRRSTRCCRRVRSNWNAGFPASPLSRSRPVW
jgi:choline dehydrogenase-like flavoprotein